VRICTFALFAREYATAVNDHQPCDGSRNA
jgi:hypothetical protein